MDLSEGCEHHGVRRAAAQALDDDINAAGGFGSPVGSRQGSYNRQASGKSDRGYARQESGKQRRQRSHGQDYLRQKSHELMLSGLGDVDTFQRQVSDGTHLRRGNKDRHGSRIAKAEDLIDDSDFFQRQVSDGHTRGNKGRQGPKNGRRDQGLRK